MAAVTGKQLTDEQKIGAGVAIELRQYFGWTGSEKLRVALDWKWTLSAKLPR